MDLKIYVRLQQFIDLASQETLNTFCVLSLVRQSRTTSKKWNLRLIVLSTSPSRHQKVAWQKAIFTTAGNPLLKSTITSLKILTTVLSNNTLTPILIILIRVGITHYNTIQSWINNFNLHCSTSSRMMS